MSKQSILVAVIVIVSTVVTPATTAQYQIIDLGSLVPYPTSHPTAINSKGRVVGYVQNIYLHRRACLFDSTESGDNIDLDTLGGNWAIANAINNNGQIVGKACNKAGQWRACRFETSYGGNNIDLGTLGWTTSHAVSINDHGQIVGYSHLDSRNYHACLFDQTGGHNNIDLGTLGGNLSVAHCINNSLQIVGYARTGSEIHACLFDSTGGGDNIDLGTLDGNDSWAYHINDNGRIVGRALDSLGNNHACLFDPTGGGNNINLGTLGGIESWAYSINNHGQIVGWAETNSGKNHACLFDSSGNGENIDLNIFTNPESGWELTYAQSINNDRWIVGHGRNPHGEYHAFLLTPVPEPSAPPVANADGPYSIYVGDMLTLDASGSTDADDDIVSYMWDLDGDVNFETDAGDQPVFDVNFAELQSLELLVNHQYTIGLKVTDSEGQSDIADSTLIIVPKPAVKVAVDIKPGSCPNPVNVKSSGVLPVAILGTADVNVLDIVPTSIAFSFGEVSVGAIRNAYEDVAGPFDSNDCNCVEAGPDGLLDLTLKFETQGIVEAIGDVNDGDILTLELTGVLFDPIPFETPIEGADCILIRGRHKPINRADINKDGVVDAADFAILAENWLRSSIVEH